MPAGGFRPWKNGSQARINPPQMDDVTSSDFMYDLYQINGLPYVLV